MKDHDGDKRSFIQTSRAYYAKTAMSGGEVDNVTLGFYSPGGGTSGEFQVSWTPLGNRIVPQLLVFDDAWHALNECRDVLGKMAKVDDENISPEDFCKLLLTLGFEDATPVDKPHLSPSFRGF